MAGVVLVLLPERTGTWLFASYAADSVFMILGSLIIAQGITKSGAENLSNQEVAGAFTGSNYA